MTRDHSELEEQMQRLVDQAPDPVIGPVTVDLVYPPPTPGDEVSDA